MWIPHSYRNSLRRFCAIALGLGVLISTATAGPPTAALADKGEAKADIYVSPAASTAIRAEALALAHYLGRITGGSFEIKQGDGGLGIAVGTVDDFPSLGLDKVLAASGARGREEYLIRSHAAGLHVIGRSELAVRHAVWDLLHRLGHRQFFPGETWEVIPDRPTLGIAVDALESPDYQFRNIGYGFGMWGYNNAPYAQWRERNRMPGVFHLRTGHAYDNVIRLNKSAFDANPEYYALVNGRRQGSKMCISNPGVQEIVVNYARNHFTRDPSSDCISIDPSDGGGWCECAPCSALGSPSDRALLLANRISEYLEAHLPGKYVALYAYNEHSPPPTIEARPRVIVNIATAFLRGGHTTTGLMDDWRRQGVRQLGIREYYSVHMWDRDLPGRARGGNTSYLAATIPDFHRRGAAFILAEASDNWGANGLGYYLASRMFWDVDEARRIDEIKRDFHHSAFGSAHEPMHEFYELIDGGSRSFLSSPMIGRMYTLLRDARDLTQDTRVHARLDHLVLYTRYVELFHRYAMASGAPRQAAFETLIRHGYRMRETMMVHAKALYRDLPSRDKTVAVPENARWNVREKANPWKQDEPWTRQELDSWVAQGIENHPPLAFEPVSFPGRLVPASGPLNLSKMPALTLNTHSRGRMTYYTWFDEAHATLELKVTGGLIAHYRDRGPVQLRLYAGLEDEATLVDQHDSPNDGRPYTVTLRARDKGLHVLTVSDGGDLSEVIFPPGQARTVEMSMDQPSRFHHRASFYFYVPKGARVIGGFMRSAHGARVHGPRGERVGRIDQSGYFTIDVPPGDDGQAWSIQSAMGGVILMTVPPFVAGSPQELLLPDEIVEKDRGR